MIAKKIKYALLLVTAVTCMSGCGKDALQQEMIDAQNNNKSIKISVNGEVSTTNRENNTWGELDQLTSYKDIRATWDDELQIVKFDSSSKNGVLYIDKDNNWTGNSTLYNAFQNKEFVNVYWQDGKVRSALAQSAIAQFSDIDNETTGLIASVNAYFNIFSANEDGTSGLLNTISRAEAMSAICRCDTPVLMTNTDEEFKSSW